MGGRGSSSSGGGGGGKNLSSKGGTKIRIVSEEDIWSTRHNPSNAPFADDINSGVRDIQGDFDGVMNTVNTVVAAELGGKDKDSVLGYYGQGRLGINKEYTNPAKMNRVYDEATKTGYHPSRGNKSGTEAVTYHEMGHAIADHLKTKLGAKDSAEASKIIVHNANKTVTGKNNGTLSFAKGISAYAADSYSECVAEAVTDWYCNGNKAAKASKAIVAEMKRINAL